MSINLSACNDDSSPMPPNEPQGSGEVVENSENTKIGIYIGNHLFTATLENNSTASAFKELLPITISMNEMNGNEKYFDLAESLPTNSTTHKTINNGDIMLFGSRTLVLFYKTFSSSYSYSKIGKLDNVDEFQRVLGSSNVTVTIRNQ